MEVSRTCRQFAWPFLVGLLLGAALVGFVLVAEADSDVIRPNGAGTSEAGTAVGCTSSLRWECLNEVVTQPTVPDTGTDYLQLVNNDTNHSQLGTFTDVDVVTSVTVWIYHREGGTNARSNVGLFAANENTIIGAQTTLTLRTGAGWDSVTYSGLSLTQTQLNDMRLRFACTKIGGGSSNDCFAYAAYVDVTYDPQIEVTVGTTGTQQNLNAGATDAHIGAAFTITENISNRNVTSITISETGTVDAQNDLANVRLVYENAADCSTASYNGGEPQFGSSGTFNSADGSITFTGSVPITTTSAMCAYVVLDVADTASAGESIEIEINNPSTDVGASGTDLDVEPLTTVALSGNTFVQAPSIDQIHYHWRDDDGDQGDTGTGATSLTGGVEDTVLGTASQLTTTRLRMGLSNEGNAATTDEVEILDEFTTGTTKTISDGEKRMLVVSVGYDGASTAGNVGTVTYGGQTLTEVDEQIITTSVTTGMWVGYLDEAGIQAASGNSISVNWDSTPDANVAYSSVVYENVDQTDPVTDSSGNTATISATIQPSAALSVDTGDVTSYFTIAAAVTTHTPATGYTEGTEEVVSSPSVHNRTAASAYKLITGSGSEQPTATFGTAQTRLAIVALNIQAAHRYRLEYAQKVTTCAAATGWADVGAAGGDWDMSDSANLTDGANTTNIASTTRGALTDENITFLTPNGGVRDVTSETGALTLGATNFVELEYSIIANASATEGNTYCFRLTDQGQRLDVYSVYPEATITADITVSSAGTQRATVDIPTSNVEAGAKFVITDNIAGDTTVQSIMITASGTVDYDNDIDDVRLMYDLDTTGADSYNCSDESFDGDEMQYGATSTDGFGAGGTATFSDSQIINPTQTMCLYVVYSVSSAATDSETLDIKIQNASTDVTINAGSVAPTSLVDLAGTTQFVTNTVTQTHYHWRDDNGNEVGASSATGGVEDTLLENLRPGVPTRVRIGVANEGSSTTAAYQYRLEYALRVSTCSAASGWTDVGATNDAFNMFNSANITDGADTTNIAVGNGGVTNVGTTFFANNNGVKDTSSQVAALALPGKNYTDLEYSVVASSTATEGATYCFRVTNAGTALNNYNVYPEVTIKPKTDFFVQRGVTTVSGTGATITAGTHYVAPSSASRAFIRIVGTNNTGAGSTANSGNADDVTAYVSNPGNIASSITFSRPATAADSTRVAWEIIEYVGASGGDNEIVVRQQSTATYGGANTTVTTGTVAGVVVDNDMAVFITGQGNPDAGVNYPAGLSTAAWNSGADTITFTRGASGNAAIVSYAAVEFVGENWRVQRSEHTYTAAGSAQTESITAVNSLTRTFLHDQKRIGSGLNTHSNFGHNVFLSGLGQVSYVLEAGATSPGSHVSVAWVIENIQTVGDTMVVSRSNGSESAGTSPKTVNVNIGTTISDMQDASLFFNNHGNEAGGGSSQNSFPEPIISPAIISETQYQLWIAQPDNDTRTWRAEVVEWPTAARDIDQNYYRFYANNNALDPTDPWPAGASDVGENTEVTLFDGPVALNDSFRLRMTLQISSAGMEPGIDSFKLQYGERTSTCDAIAEGQWTDVGDIGSGALWRGTSTPLTDGTVLSTDPPAGGDLNISVADVAATFEEENPSAFTPYVVDPGEDVEFDWIVQHNGAIEKTTYCFRMLEANGTLFDNYFFYPAIRTAGYTPIQSQWRFYDDETNVTPTVALGGENVSPSSIAEGNIIKLRTTVAETTGGQGTNAKFKLQFSETPDFSAAVFDVVSSVTCAETATTTAQLWCYADGGGVDNAQIDSALLSDADSCTGGSGLGCGTHNESSATTTATYDQPGLSVAEYEFTIRHNGARANAVYYFRLFDAANATTVLASTSYPSLQVAGSDLIFTTTGVPAGAVTEGIVTDTATASSSITFGDVPFDTQYEAAYRLTINTNATEGYQAFMVVDQYMHNTYAETIPSITGSNSTPIDWSTGCSGLTACFGYHVGDDSLFGGSSRFAPDNSYSALSPGTPEEVAFSSVPTNESHDIVYKIEVSEEQSPGDYGMNVSFIVIPVF